MAETDLQQTLDRILNELQSNDPARCISALEELALLDASTPALLRRVEYLALHDASETVRKTALDTLPTQAHRAVYKKGNTLSQGERRFLLREIEKWESDSLLEPQHARIIKLRYNFDLAPVPIQTQPVVDTPVIEKVVLPQAVAELPISIAQPRPSLMQTLLSESSIKIYLYLGAFFVIASALILAAVVEAARLPILVAATSAFGGGAFVIRKRLPQPSFALFIVFSFLLPIDANVLEETIGFSEPALSIYWTIIFLGMALIWGFSIWFYASSFFSLVAFVALSLAFYRAAQIFQTETELPILFGMFASLAGLAGTSLLKKWKDGKFAAPVFLLAQVQVLGLLLVSIALVILQIFEPGISNGWWLVISLTWIAASSFFVASNFLFPFPLFPWMAVAALLPVPWFILNSFEPQQNVYSIGFWIAGAMFALLSQVVFRFERFKSYGWALLAGSLPLFLTAIVIAIDWDSPVLTFALLAGTALIYSGLHRVHPRWYVWSVALLSALSAYFVLFTLPILSKLNIPPIYQFLGAVLLLTVPELFARSPLTLRNQSRLPALALGVLVSLVCISIAVEDVDHPGRTAIAFITFAILFTFHAFHSGRTWIGYLAITAEVIAILYALAYFDRDLWLPALTLMSVLYYGTGFFLRRMDASVKDWGIVLVNSGLILGGLLSLSALLAQKETAGWYILLIAMLYAVEIFARPLALLEVGVEILLSLALYRVLADFNPPDAMEHVLFGTSLIWLGGDLLFGRLIEKRIHRPLTLGVGFLFVAATSVSLFSQLHNLVPVAYFLLYAAFFALYAFMQHEPRLAYFTAAFIPLAVIKLYEFRDLEKWMFPLIVLAVCYYALGFVLRRNQKGNGWDTTLLYSGLALAVLTSLSAPFQGALESSIPIVVAATLFSIEAFARRNVWWALPANALYLFSYFVILASLNVDEPQFYSIGAALLGMLMHYLLTRAGSKAGAFLMGMLSQLVLLGTTYIQMLSTSELKFFFVLFAQSMIVLVYGLIQRSRSLVITPIVFAVLGVVTVVYSALKGLSSVILVGCTGIVLLLFGIGAVILRERITRIGDQLSDWKP